MLNYLRDSSGGLALQGKGLDFINLIMEDSPSGVCVTDSDGVIRCFNRAYEDLSGMAKKDMLGRNVRDLVDEGVVSASGTLKALEQRQQVEVKQQFQTRKCAVITSAPVFDQEGELLMVVTHAQCTARIVAYEDQLFGLKQILQVDCKINQGEATSTRGLYMTEAMKLAKRAAKSELPVLIEGEPGTGKKRVAVYICNNSKRKGGRFVTVPCGAVPEGRLERELFGEANDAQEPAKVGLLEMADKGTVFFDEIAALSLDLQQKLLQIILEKEVLPVGSQTKHRVDIRLLAATSRNLEDMMLSGAFNKELYYKLSAFPIILPALRYRKDDILPLAEDILQEMNRINGTNKTISRCAALALLSYEWPGNVSELRNVVELAATGSKDDYIKAQDLAVYKAVPPQWEGPQLGTEPICLKDILEELEYGYILRAYKKHHNVRKAAACLSMDAATYVRKRKKYGQKMRESDQEKGA